MEKSENTQVVATRSHWVIGGVVLSAAMLPLCIVAAIFFREAGDRIMFGAAFVLFFAAMIYYLYLACTLPKIMIAYKKGKFYFHPTKKQTVILPSEEVGEVRRNHHTGADWRIYARPSGKLIVDYKGGPGVFRFVANLEYAEKTIEKIKRDRREELLREKLLRESGQNGEK